MLLWSKISRTEMGLIRLRRSAGWCRNSMFLHGTKVFFSCHKFMRCQCIKWCVCIRAQKTSVPLVRLDFFVISCNTMNNEGILSSHYISGPCWMKTIAPAKTLLQTENAALHHNSGLSSPFVFRIIISSSICSIHGKVEAKLFSGLCCSQVMRYWCLSPAGL